MKTHRRLLLLVSVVALVVVACDWRPLIDPPPGGGEVTTETFRLGPFDLAPGEDVETTLPAPRPDGAFGMVGMRFRVVDDQGQTLSAMDGIHLHHIVMQNRSATDALCSNRSERFGGSGMELTPIAIPDPYAYLVNAGDQWSALFHLMNNQGTNGGHGVASTAKQRMYIEYDVDLQRGATRDTVRPVTPLYLDVTGCGNSEFAVPGTGTPATYTVTDGFVAPADGIAVFTLAHFHAGGISQRLVGQTETWCESVGEYSQMGHLVRIPACTLHHQVEKGQTYTVESTYENDEPIPDAMAIQFSYVWWGTQ